jgi:eukaryotic-like serine/threonine-protein kinase
VPAFGNFEYGHPIAPLETLPQLQYGMVRASLPERTSEMTYDELTVATLDLLHRLLLAEPGELRRAASLYFAYHPWIEPATQMVLAPVVAGSFLMGSPETEPERLGHEGPQHQVTLSHDFWMGIYPVTQEQYQIVMGENPSEFRGQNRPVENVSWEDAVAFCERLTEHASVSGLVPEGYVFRLPTEAEWEYCCRAGTDTATAFGDRLSSQQANFDGNYPYGDAEKGPYLEQTSDVGSYPANPWGLFDMHGNVWEWCLDAADWDDRVKTDTYVDGVIDPLCQVGRYRVLRGGSWLVNGRDCRSACRTANDPGARYGNLGFRVCLARSPAAGQGSTVRGRDGDRIACAPRA